MTVTNGGMHVHMNRRLFPFGEIHVFILFRNEKHIGPSSW